MQDNKLELPGGFLRLLAPINALQERNVMAGCCLNPTFINGAAFR